MKYFIIAIMIFTASLQATTIGVIKKIEGKAKIQHQTSFKKKRLKAQQRVETGDTVLTYKDSKVVIELTDKTKIVLDSFAKLKLVSLDEYEQNGGKIFFKVTKRKGGKGLKVKTPFAIIGVKGTEFVVTDDNRSKALALNKGLVAVDSPDGKKFQHIDEDKVKGKMPATPKEVNAEFEAYKKEIYKEFSEYKSSFDLHPGKKLNFNGHQVFESSQNSDDQKMFKLYMSDAEFNAISKELEEEVTSKPKNANSAFDSDFFGDDF